MAALLIYEPSVLPAFAFRQNLRVYFCVDVRSKSISLRTATHRPNRSCRGKVIARTVVRDSHSRCNLAKPFSSTRSITGVSDTRLPLRQCKSARMILVLAWVVFWLNTALFPCCEAFAVAFDDHADDVSQSVPAAAQAHHSGETQVESPHHKPDSPCDYTLHAGSVINGEHAGPATDRIQLESVAIYIAFAVWPPVTNRSAKLAPHDFHPPPPFRLYLHTQRLLI
jgi:hypothetical protein